MNFDDISEYVAPFLEIELFPSIFAENPGKLMKMTKAHAFTNYSLADEEKLALANSKSIHELPFLLRCRLFSKFSVKKIIQKTRMLTYEDKLKTFRYSHSNGLAGSRDAYCFFIYNIFRDQQISIIKNVYSKKISDSLNKGERRNLRNLYFLEKYHDYLRLFRSDEVLAPSLIGFLLPESSTLTIFSFEKADFMPLIISDININS